MDRRGFISGVGALAATAGATVGVTNLVEAREAAAAKTRSAGLALSAGMPPSAAETPITPDTRLVNVAFIPETELVTTRSGALYRDLSRAGASGSGAKVVPYTTESRYGVTLAGLRRARRMPALQRLDVVARFAIDESPHFAAFFAWSHVAGVVPKTSSPVNFTALGPDRAALEINYLLAPEFGSTSGRLYFPIGGTGLAPGIYVMTTPSASTGTTPAMQDFSYSGNPDAPMTGTRGVPLDFDHFVFAIRTYRG